MPLCPTTRTLCHMVMVMVISLVGVRAITVVTFCVCSVVVTIVGELVRVLWLAMAPLMITGVIARSRWVHMRTSGLFQRGLRRRLVSTRSLVEAFSV